MNSKLNPEILVLLKKKTGLEISTIRKNISILKSDYPSCTSNAVAQIYARKNGFTVMRKLNQEDKKSLPHMTDDKKRIIISSKKSNPRDKYVEFIKYPTSDYFIKGHILEINMAYSKGCYTSVHILTRKIIENLIRQILTNNFPPSSLENKELYYDTAQNRFKDFNIILKNLLDKKYSFIPDKIKPIERLYQLAKKFKDDSNDATHSWYHLIERKSEIDDLNVQTMIELIIRIER